jgi:hypothetical protein
MYCAGAPPLGPRGKIVVMVAQLHFKLAIARFYVALNCFAIFSWQGSPDFRKTIYETLAYFRIGRQAAFGVELHTIR